MRSKLKIIIIIFLAQYTVACNSIFYSNSGYSFSVDSLKQVDFKSFIGSPIIDLLKTIKYQYVKRLPIQDTPEALFGYSFIYNDKTKLNLYIDQCCPNNIWMDSVDFERFERFKLTGYRLYYNDTLIKTSYDDLSSKYDDLLQERRELTQIADSILNEGINLYRLEKSAWIASDAMLLDHKIDYDSLQGYISYYKEDTVRAIFYSLNNNVLLTYNFRQKEGFNYDVSYQKRKPTLIEEKLINIKEQVYKMITIDTVFFQKYYGVNYNITIKQRDSIYFCYILSASNNVMDSVFLGNDYLLKFSVDGKLLSKEKIHKGLMKIKVKEQKEGKLLEATMHNHFEGYSPFMSSTDICTLLLYKDFISWKYHLVYSSQYISIFNIQKNVLIIKKLDSDAPPE